MGLWITEKLDKLSIVFLKGVKMIKMVCYDVNGTILNDTEQFLDVINGVFQKLGRRPLPREVLRERFGQPWTKIYRDEGITEAMASDEELYKIYNELYGNQSPAEPFNDLRLTLEILRGRGVALAIVSTQQNSITLPLLEKHRLMDFFAHVEGGVFDKAEAIKNIVQKFGVKLEESVYVGDQEGDVLHANKAGCVSIAFGGGLHSVARLLKASPKFLIVSHKEIADLPIF